MNRCLILGPVDPVDGLPVSGLCGVGLFISKHL